MTESWIEIVLDLEASDKNRTHEYSVEGRIFDFREIHNFFFHPYPKAMETLKTFLIDAYLI